MSEKWKYLHKVGSDLLGPGNAAAACIYALKLNEARQQKDIGRSDMLRRHVLAVPGYLRTEPHAKERRNPPTLMQAQILARLHPEQPGSIRSYGATEHPQNRDEMKTKVDCQVKKNSAP